MALAEQQLQRITVDGVEVAFRTMGSGPPLVLLHGYPQTHLMWHQVAPALAEQRTLVLPDLRGYGESAKPVGTDNYAKRAMAADVVGLLSELGHDRFDVVGHDRGARVTHRLCLDHPDRVRRAAVLDIVPTRHVFGTADRELGLAYYHWFFLAQPHDLPEHLIGADPEYWIRYCLTGWARREGAFTDDAVAAYVRAFRDPETVRATCDDYRAGANIDLENDDASYDAGDRVACPLLVLWGGQGFVGSKYDVRTVWRDYASDISFGELDCGHFLPEERPAETTAALLDFL